MSPAIMFCGASDNMVRLRVRDHASQFPSRFGAGLFLPFKFSCAPLSGARDFLCCSVLGETFFHTENKTSRGLAGTAVTRATLGTLYMRAPAAPPPTAGQFRLYILHVGSLRVCGLCSDSPGAASGGYMHSQAHKPLRLGGSLSGSGFVAGAPSPCRACGSPTLSSESPSETLSASGASSERVERRPPR